MRQVILAVVLFSTFASAQASLISMSGDFKRYHRRFHWCNEYFRNMGRTV